MNPEKELNVLVRKIEHHTHSDFDELALEIFRYQYRNNPVYQSYVDLRKKNVASVRDIREIPFLPISVFKSHSVMTGTFEPEMIFESSGTTGSVSSKHIVKSLSLYEHSFMRSFYETYGKPEDWVILCLLPSYLERGGSSLVYMADKLMRISNKKENGFYLYDFPELAEKIKQLESSSTPTLLLGVSYALLDFGESFPMKLKSTIIMETGGMKGRRKELNKTALHQMLGTYFGLEKIHSEYGMTELMSQAYSSGDGLFKPGSGMKILLRRSDDPLEIRQENEEQESITGGINVIDLHNVNSCSFIATEDLGRLHPDGQFEVLGRLENSEIRGCGLMYTN